MKGIFSLLLLLVSVALLAQAPQALSYQGSARDISGVLLASQPLSVRFSVRQSTATGAVVYQEEHTTTTSPFGGFALQIGRGTASTGSFPAINWAVGPFFLEVELDVNNTGTYTSMGATEMLSVPYALYSERAGVADTALVAANNGNCVRASLPGEFIFDNDSLYNNGTYQVYYNTSPALWESMSIALVNSKVYVNGVFKKIEGTGLSIIAPFASASVRNLISGDIVKIEFLIHTETCLVKHEHNIVIP